MGRFKFALWSLRARLDGSHDQCPYCKSKMHARLERKRLVMEARKCSFCGLIFRWPTTTDAEAEQFYQNEYQSGIVTDLPDEAELLLLKKTNMKGSRFDKTFQIDWVEKNKPAPSRVLVFGSSWGYFDYQLKQRGYEVEGLELSRPRAEFGRKHLGLTIHTSWNDCHGYLPNECRFDLIFTSHTMEHLTDVKSTLDHFSKVIKPNGNLIVIVPNGGGIFARTMGVKWAPFVGSEHTVAYTADWFKSNLSRHGWTSVTATSTTPEGQYDATCDGDGLMIIATF